MIVFPLPRCVLRCLQLHDAFILVFVFRGALLNKCSSQVGGELASKTL